MLPKKERLRKSEQGGLLWAVQVSLHWFLFHLSVVVCEFVNDFTVGKALLSTFLD